MYDVLCARLLHYIVKFRYVEAKKKWCNCHFMASLAMPRRRYGGRSGAVAARSQH